MDMRDKHGDYLIVYPASGDVFIDCFYDAQTNLQFRAILERKQALELIDKLQSALNELDSTNC